LNASDVFATMKVDRTYRPTDLTVEFMAKFTVVYVKGRAVGKGSYARFEPLSGKTLHSVETASRINAYIKTYEHLTRLGMKVFVATDGADESPLGMSTREIEFITEQGVPIDTQVKDGVRIDKIIAEI
jgi:hypothetical protein